MHYTISKICQFFYKNERPDFRPLSYSFRLPALFLLTIQGQRFSCQQNLYTTFQTAGSMLY